MAITGDCSNLFTLGPPGLTGANICWLLKHISSSQAGGTYPTGMLSRYWPKRSFGQGNVFTRVCHSVHRGGYLTRHPLGPGRYPPRPGRNPPDQAGTPRDQTPPDQGRTPRDQTAPSEPGRNPPPDQTPLPRNSRLRNTVNVRPVRILLECILVSWLFTNITTAYLVFCAGESPQRRKTMLAHLKVFLEKTPHFRKVYIISFNSMSTVWWRLSCSLTLSWYV